MPGENPWSLNYHDGNGNRYHFWKGPDGSSIFFEYSPVIPRLSSSGLYSGGNPKKGSLDVEQIETLWQWMEELESNVSLHSKTKVKGSGTVHLSTSDGVRKFTVKAGLPLREFNKFLETLRNS